MTIVTSNNTYGFDDIIFFSEGAYRCQNNFFSMLFMGHDSIFTDTYYQFYNYYHHTYLYGIILKYDSKKFFIL